MYLTTRKHSANILNSILEDKKISSSYRKMTAVELKLAAGRGKGFGEKQQGFYFRRKGTELECKYCL
jgi:hypothetical protein